MTEFAAPDSDADFARPEALVSTEWVAAHLDDSAVRLVESVEDPLLYEVGHVPGAVKLDWHTELQDPVRRDIVDRAGFERLLGRLGIASDTTVVFYGDQHNWNACLALWIFRSYGHADCRVMDGGRAKWEAEGRPLAREVPAYPPTRYVARERDRSFRAHRDDVLALVASGAGTLLDVRSLEEYAGALVLLAGHPQVGARRRGHIPGAINVPWERTINPDETFRSAAELRALYEGAGITADRDVIVYCWVGERSSHTWFALSRLLGYPAVRHYDGGWTEWGNLIDVPVALST